MNRPYGGWALKHKMLHAPFSGVRFPVPPVTRPVGPCFSCGEYGHLWSSCPKTTGTTYPFLNIYVDMQGYGVSIPKGNRVDNAIGNNVVDCVDELEYVVT